MSRALRFASEVDVLRTTARISSMGGVPARGGPGNVSPHMTAGANPAHSIPLERDILAAILELLQVHPKVAFAWRQNAGGFEVNGRMVRAAFKGCADILGMLTTGRFLAIETKRPGEHPTPDQTAFLLAVARHGGLSFVARSVDDVTRKLQAA